MEATRDTFNTTSTMHSSRPRSKDKLPHRHRQVTMLPLRLRVVLPQVLYQIHLHRHRLERREQGRIALYVNPW